MSSTPLQSGAAEPASDEDPIEDHTDVGLVALQMGSKSEGHGSSRAGFETPLNLAEISAQSEHSIGFRAVLPPQRPSTSQPSQGEQ